MHASAVTKDRTENDCSRTRLPSESVQRYVFGGVLIGYNRPVRAICSRLLNK
jgi:hypothetical protein